MVIGCECESPIGQIKEDKNGSRIQRSSEEVQQRYGMSNMRQREITPPATIDTALPLCLPTFAVVEESLSTPCMHTLTLDRTGMVRFVEAF